MEDSAVEVQPDPMLLPQVVLELTYLALHLIHGGYVLLRLCGHHCIQLLHLVRALHKQCPTSGTELNHCRYFAAPRSNTGDAVVCCQHVSLPNSGSCA